jgi:hypothetical protein
LAVGPTTTAAGAKVNGGKEGRDRGLLAAREIAPRVAHSRGTGMDNIAIKWRRNEPIMLEIR